jgi:hypothetical protein
LCLNQLCGFETAGAGASPTKNENALNSLSLFDLDSGSARTVEAGLALRTIVTNSTRCLSSVSHDGRAVAAAMASGEVAILSLDGGPVRAVPGTGPNDLPIQWTRDGRRLFLLDPSSIPSRILSVDVATGERTICHEIVPVDPAGVAGIDHAAITPDATAYAYAYSQFRSDLYLLKGLR